MSAFISFNSLGILYLISPLFIPSINFLDFSSVSAVSSFKHVPLSSTKHHPPMELKYLYTLSDGKALATSIAFSPLYL